MPGTAFLEEIGRFGVILFFLHTSLVLMLSLGRTALERAFAVRFYVRRAFRIYPLAILAVTTTYVLHLPPNAWSKLHYYPIGISQLISNLLLVQNVTQKPPVLDPLWSLPLEVQMYVVLPFFSFWLGPKNGVCAYSSVSGFPSLQPGLCGGLPGSLIFLPLSLAFLRE